MRESEIDLLPMSAAPRGFADRKFRRAPSWRLSIFSRAFVVRSARSHLCRRLYSPRLPPAELGSTLDAACPAQVSRLSLQHRHPPTQQSLESCAMSLERSSLFLRSLRSSLRYRQPRSRARAHRLADRVL